MNTYETKLYNDLTSGKNAADLLVEFEAQLNAAKKKYEEEQRILAEKKAAEEAKRKADEAKKRMQTDLDAKRITELANNALNHRVTAEDVSWLWTRYASQRWNKSEVILNQLLQPKEVDEMIDMAVKMLEGLDPLITFMGANWDQVAKDAAIEIRKTTDTKPENKAKSDHDIIRDFINKIC